MRYSQAVAITQRHTRLLRLIRKGTFSAPVLAAKLGVSGQTIYRDIDFLKQRGHCVKSEKHADGWAYHLIEQPAPTSTEKELER